MPIGLFFGSFNPIHIGHLIIANHVLNETNVRKVWFVLSPHNPFKKTETLLNEFDRLHILQKAIVNDPRLKAIDIEFSLPKPSYTATTLAYLTEKYPSQEFRIIIGSDSFQNIRKWHNADFIIKGYKLIIYERPGFKVQNILNADMQVMKAPLLEIAASQIRHLVKSGKSIRYMVPEAIEEDILNNRFFRR